MGEEKWHLPVPLFPKRSLCECCLSGTGYEMSKEPPHCVPRVLFWSLFPGFMSLDCALPYLQKLPQCLWVFSEPSSLTLRTPVFKPQCLQAHMKYGHSCFLRQKLWGFVSRALPSVLVSLTFCHALGSLSTSAAMICFTQIASLHVLPSSK